MRIWMTAALLVALLVIVGCRGSASGGDAADGATYLVGVQGGG